MKIILKSKFFFIFFLISLVFILHLNVAHAVPAIPGRSLPLEGIFSIPRGSHSYVDGSDVAIITRPLNDQRGAIFSTDSNKIDLEEDFSASMLMYFGNKDTAAADGMTFVMHNDLSAVTNFIGTTGDSLGVYAINNISWDTQSTILQNSFAIEFDTYYNGVGLDKRIDKNGDRGHVAWSFPGERSSYEFDGFDRVVALNHKNLYEPSQPLSNGQWHTLTVDWEASSRTLTYSFDGDIVSIEIPFAIFGTNDVFWGFTGSTGGQFQESAVAFTQVPGLVNLEKSFEVLDKDNADINGGTIKSKETSIVNFDLRYAGGHQELIDPEVIFDLAENSRYKEGTLTLNGSLVNDAQFIADNYSYRFSNLNSVSPDARFSFEIENINETEEAIDSSVSAHLDAKNFLSGNFRSDFTIERRLNILSLGSTQSSIEFSGSEMNVLNSLSNEGVLQKVIDKAGVVVTASDGNIEDTIITNNYPGALLALKGLEINGIYSFELIAKREEEKSEPIVIAITHIPGEVRFESYPSTIGFEEELGTSSSKLFKAIPGMELSVSDTRTNGSQWTLQVSASDLTSSDSKTLQGYFKYFNETGSIIINDSMQPILTGRQGLDGPSILDVSTDWSATNGLVFETSNANYLGTYSGTMNWQLLDVP